MSTMTARTLRRRLSNIGLKYQDAWIIAKWYDKNLSSRGHAGAIDYFKRVGETLHASVTGVGCSQPWVATYGPRKIPRIFKNMKYPDAIWLKVSKFARAVKLPELQQSQVDKVYNAVVSDYSGTPDALDTVDTLVKSGVQLFPLRRSKFGKAPLVTKQFRRVTSYSGTTPVVSEPPVLESLVIVARNSIFKQLPWWCDVFKPITASSVKDLVSNLEGRTDLFETDAPKTVGFYSYSQEGAGKCRAYASPFTVIQCLIDPIKDYLTPILRSLATDCTFDQDAGARWAQSKMNQGITIHSIDLSTATCRFPLAPQVTLLKELGIPDHIIDVLLYVCRGNWLVHKDFQEFNVPDLLSWSVGQPLGISPSIRMFSLVHNALLAGICRDIGRKPKNCFRVLGDDVIISDNSVKERYMDVITKLGVPISTSKSWSSDSFAEFAGFQITKDTMVRPGQWGIATPINHLGLAEHLGKPLKSEVDSLSLIAEKLHLFRKGIYTPPAELLTCFLKANYLLEGWEDFYQWQSLTNPSPLLWIEKIRSVVYDQLKTVKLTKYLNFASIMRPTWETYCHKCLDYEEIVSLLPDFTEDNIPIGSVMVSIWFAIRGSSLSEDVQKMLWEQSLQSLDSSLWAVPLSLSKEKKSDTERLTKTFRKAILHGKYVDTGRVEISESVDTTLMDLHSFAVDQGCDPSSIWSLTEYKGDPYDSIEVLSFLHKVGAL